MNCLTCQADSLPKWGKTTAGNQRFRCHCRRFTRLTNAFSKLWRNHRAAVSLTVAHYNLCTMHSSIRMTPAMKAGITNRVWGLGDLLAA